MLRDNGYITSAEAKRLKKIKLYSDGKRIKLGRSGSRSGSGGKKIRVSIPGKPSGGKVSGSKAKLKTIKIEPAKTSTKAPTPPKVKVSADLIDKLANPNIKLAPRKRYKTLRVKR